MAMMMTMMMKALVTPGIARKSAMMILLSALTRLNSRKTRKARSVLRDLSAPESAPVLPRMEMMTMMKSKIFHLRARAGA